MDYPSTLAPYPGFLRAANAVAIVIQSVRYDIHTGTVPNTPLILARTTAAVATAAPTKRSRAVEGANRTVKKLGRFAYAILKNHERSLLGTVM